MISVRLDTKKFFLSNLMMICQFSLRFAPVEHAECARYIVSTHTALVSSSRSPLETQRIRLYPSRLAASKAILWLLGLELRGEKR